MTETKECLLCGKPFSNAHWRAKYCSPSCRRKAEAKKRLSYISKRAQSHNKYKSDVVFAYDSKCAICGWQISDKTLTLNGKTQYAHGNEIHHITPVSEGGTNDFENLILLCPNHHKMADLGLIEREKLYALVPSKEELAKKKSDAQREASCMLARIFLSGLDDPDDFKLEMTE